MPRLLTTWQVTHPLGRSERASSMKRYRSMSESPLAGVDSLMRISEG